MTPRRVGPAVIEGEVRRYDRVVALVWVVVTVEPLPQPMATVATPRAMARTSSFFIGNSGECLGRRQSPPASEGRTRSRSAMPDVLASQPQPHHDRYLPFWIIPVKTESVTCGTT